jgi:hypothetical protein
VNSEKFYMLRERTCCTTELFRMHRYKVIEKWECDYMHEGKITCNLLTQLHHTSFFVYLNLNPHDALFFLGGGTSPTKLFHESLLKKTCYYDFTSLDPYVQKKYCYPIMHPEIICGISKCSKIDIGKVFGLVKCKVLAPTNLLFPILPVRTDKITFPLCRMCVEQQCKMCMHDEEHLPCMELGLAQK